ncbi:hypothetical protein bcgnr5378_65350 [Bacillus cereus]
MDELHDTYRFLSLFRKDDEIVTLGLLHENKEVENNLKVTMLHLPYKMEKASQSLYKWTAYKNSTRYYVRSYNHKYGKGVFFVVNQGGKKDEEITSVRSWFVDADFAKIERCYNDEKEAQGVLESLKKTGDFEEITIHVHNDKYVIKGTYILDVVAKKKEQFLGRFENELKSALIVETYSGFHIYFLTDSGDVKTFTGVQIALANKFDGDIKCVNLARVMRVPGFIHQKYKTTFEIEVRQWSEKRWDEQELIKTLDLKIGVEQTRGYAVEQEQEEVSHNTKLTRGVNVKVKKKMKSALTFRSPVPAEDEMTFNEALERVLSEPLSSFVKHPDMHEGDKVLCPFHDDSRASGHVFKSKRGEMLYKCHACEVGTKNIIGLYMAHTNSKYRTTVKNLAAVLGIKIIKNEFELKQQEKYVENRLFLEQDLMNLFPSISHFIDRYGRRGFLRYFNDKGETTVLKEDYAYKEHNVFFVSHRFIKRETNKTSLNTIRKTVFLLNLLGFIERVPEEFIPKDMKKRAEQEKKLLREEIDENASLLDEKEKEKARKRMKELRIINFYVVTNWNDNAFEIEKMACELIEKGFTFSKHITKTGLSMLLGEEVANRVYPDNRQVSQRFQKICNKLKEMVQEDMETKGFAIAEEIIARRLRINDNGKTIWVKTEEKEDVFNRGINQILENNWKISKVLSEKKKKLLGYSEPKERMKLIETGKVKSLAIRLISMK